MRRRDDHRRGDRPLRHPGRRRHRDGDHRIGRGRLPGGRRIRAPARPVRRPVHPRSRPPRARRARHGRAALPAAVPPRQDGSGRHRRRSPAAGALDPVGAPGHVVAPRQHRRRDHPARRHHGWEAADLPRGRRGRPGVARRPVRPGHASGPGGGRRRGRGPRRPRLRPVHLPGRGRQPPPRPLGRVAREPGPAHRRGAPGRSGPGRPRHGRAGPVERPGVRRGGRADHAGGGDGGTAVRRCRRRRHPRDRVGSELLRQLHRRSAARTRSAPIDPRPEP